MPEDFARPHLIFTAMGDFEGKKDVNKCFSELGRKGSQGQVVNYGNPNCFTMGTVMHEILHALGELFTRSLFEFFAPWFSFSPGATHEQNRSDRDHYIHIDKDAITPQEFETNYRMADGSFNSRGSPYDFKSLMQYPSEMGTAIRDPLLPKVILE